MLENNKLIAEFMDVKKIVYDERYCHPVTHKRVMSSNKKVECYAMPDDCEIVSNMYTECPGYDWDYIDGTHYLLFFDGDLLYDKSWDWLMPVMEKMSSPLIVKVWGTYRSIEGEDVQLIVHQNVRTTRYVALNLEYGRRFKEFMEYKKDGETMFEPCYRVVIKFIKWYNEHK